MATERDLGMLTRGHPREVWANEAQDFTPWLEEHIDLLGEALGMDLEITGREVAVGDFSLDLLGKETGTDRVVIIENQLERTDHDHLGKMLTYAGGLDARVVVWVSGHVRDEHREAIHWLNEQTTDAVAFFAVELEVLKIDDSLPAPRFNVVAQPSEFQREIVKRTTDAPGKRGIAYQEFFASLVRQLHAAHPGFTNRSADNVRYDNWKDFSVGRAGFLIRVDLPSSNRFRVGYYIDTGDRTQNKASFDQLQREANAIEAEIGEPLTWERLDDRRAVRVSAHRDGGIDSPDSVLDEHKRWAVDLVLRFRDAFAPRVQSLDLEALAADAYEEAAP